MNKNSLRKKYISYRKKIPKNEFIQKNYNIFFQLRKVFFYYKKIYEKKYYHVFLPIRKYNEINTFIIIDFLLKKKNISPYHIQILINYLLIIVFLIRKLYYKKINMEFMSLYINV